MDLADVNSRMKDFYDIWGLSNKFPFDGQLLQEAILATCRRRNTIVHSSAEIFSNDFSDRSEKKDQWKAFIKKGIGLDTPEDFVTVMSDIKTFLFPIAQSIENRESFQGSWPEGVMWTT